MKICNKKRNQEKRSFTQIHDPKNQNLSYIRKGMNINIHSTTVLSYLKLRKLKSYMKKIEVFQKFTVITN